MKIQITPQSREGIAIRDCYDLLQDLAREIESAGETLGQPHSASQHLVRATNKLSQAKERLIATGVIQYQQLTLK